MTFGEMVALFATRAQFNTLRKRVKRRITLIPDGQSVGQGTLPTTDRSAWPRAFQSQRMPGVQVPFTPELNVASRGGPWPYVFDELYDAGWEARFINCAVGGASVIDHMCGFINARQNSTSYCQQRLSPVYPDRGDFGQLVAVGGKIFYPTVGRIRSAFAGGNLPNLVGTSATQDFVSYSSSAPLTASSTPDVSGVAVGGAYVDGGITFTRFNDVLLPYESDFDPVTGNYNWGGFLGERSAGRGFDPLWIIGRKLWAAAMAPPSEGVMYLWDHAQSDLGSSANAYQRALMLTHNPALRRGHSVMIGTSIYSGGSANSTAANYAALVAGAEAAVAALSAIYPGRVFRGPNLYALMGSSGVMGAQRSTASMSGTTLTVSALLSGGSGIEVGHTLYNGQTAVGTILSQLSGTNGGVGTYQVSASATIASTTVVTAGAWMQWDGVHPSPAGYVGPDVGGRSCMAKYWADAILNALPLMQS